MGFVFFESNIKKRRPGRDQEQKCLQQTQLDLFTKGTYHLKENENFYLSIYIFYVHFTSSFISHTKFLYNNTHVLQMDHLK